MQAIHFGAGNIGRGFIGLLLQEAQYNITFVDVNENLVDHLKEKQHYTVQYANENRDQFIVNNVTALSGDDISKVAEHITSATIITTAVGVHILPYIAPAIAEGITQRAKLNLPPLAIVACENAIRASSILKEHVVSLLSEELKQTYEQFATFPDAAVDRIVPIQHHEDPLFVTVEPFYEWTIEKTNWPTNAPLIGGVHYVDQLDAYIERKLFTVNTGHCTAAYHGYRKGYTTIQEAMKDEELVQEVRSTLQESGDALIAEYGLDRTAHNQYIEQILERFKNPYLTDEILRIGRSPIRKISSNDRLIRPALLAYQYGIAVDHLTKAVAAALVYKDNDDKEAVELQQFLLGHGIDQTITKYTGLADDHPLHQQIHAQYNLLGEE
ncbi:MAG: mannitol-1-phosphate 5-dehydrogenase [Candidatus Pristimantibacillus lignocellulolyticus]|uniref:Mannitol-1-phosphate 5-dehydrogenase n=1 Tax=Candidatus Pristimantibacillus lignocellulolyticus TaxID=2994561 RepID=A0A9J6ZEZ5_9BACL|nr:MAG: mannitol-1-phosphate 5-dehydrogenase [Candidatus Pristimantibacillus lignocellulolyticus]